MLPHVTATRYLTPLRESGSLPGLMEADGLVGCKPPVGSAGRPRG